MFMNCPRCRHSQLAGCTPFFSEHCSVCGYWFQSERGWKRPPYDGFC